MFDGHKNRFVSATYTPLESLIAPDTLGILLKFNIARTMDFPRFCKPPTKDPTRYIFASGFAPNTTNIEEKMREIFASFGEFDTSFNGGVMKDLTKVPLLTLPMHQ